jgi:DNA polymerase III epsilon subunit-like protein
MNKNWVMIDIEADGPAPGLYSMIELGAVVVEPGLTRTFYTSLQPISSLFVPEALNITGYSREQTMAFTNPLDAIMDFDKWLKDNVSEQPRFISDNNGFDWQFVNYYFWKYLNRNPFGYSSQNLGSLYKGMKRDTRQNFKHLRKTAHTHNPVDDARGNAEAMLAMAHQGFNF